MGGSEHRSPSTEGRPEANKGEFALNPEDNGGEVGAEPRSPDKQRITAGFASLALLWVALHCQRAESAARGVSQKKKMFNAWTFTQGKK